MKTPILKIICFICVLSISLLSSGCSNTNTSDYIYQTSFLFDTVITIQIYDSTDETILNEAFEICETYENLFSRTIEGSDIYNINSANGAPVLVSDDTIDLLEIGIYYGDLSDGTFDITIAPLSILWDFSNNTGSIPSDDEITDLISAINYQTIEIDGNYVTLSNPEAMIDLGGIAKGYIADQVKAYLLDQGVEHAIINLGGNILTVGSHVDGSEFIIGIQKPFGESNTAITSVSLKDQSVVSSGVYERYFEIDDMIYHHILNPETGYPYDTDLYGVSIISDSSVDGDALSTICITLGLEKGMELINSLDNIEAIFITENMEVFYTYE